MSLLQKYILKKIFFTFLGVMIFLVGIFILVRTMEMLDTFLQTSGKFPPSHYFWYYVTEIPYTFNYLFPIGTLFTIVFALGKMNSEGELIIIYASGKSLMHYLYPVAIILFLTCTLLMVFDYELLFKSHQRHMDIHRSFRGFSFTDLDTKVRNNFIQFGLNDKIYIVSSYQPKIQSLENVKILHFDKNTSIDRIQTFKKADKTENEDWAIQNLSQREFNNNRSSHYSFLKKSNATLESDANLFIKNPHDPVHLSRLQIKKEIEKLKITGGNINKWTTEYHVKIAAPFVAFIMFFLGVPLSTFSRGSVLVLSFFWVLIIAFNYMVLLNIGIALGHNAYLPPIIGGWLGNIVFSIIAFFLFKKLQR